MMRTMKRQSGMSLLEALIAILVLGFGAVAMAGLQARALKGGESSVQRSQATIFAVSLLDELRSDTNLRSSTGMQCDVIADNPKFNAWLVNIKASMGGGSSTCGEIECSAVGDGFLCSVRVQWDDSRSTGSATEQIEIGTLI